MKDILAQGFAEMGILPPPGAVEKLCRYADLLLEQNRVMNLTAITEPEQVARLHFLDSAAVLAWGRAWSPLPRETGQPGKAPSQSLAPQCGLGQRGEGPHAQGGQGSWLCGKRVIDVGTGAGFPGLVLKLLEPSIELTLLDSLGKRVTWLSEVCKALSLDGVQCLHARAEEQAGAPGFRDGFDLVTSRAVAAYPQLCELCLPYARVGGAFIAMKSVESGAEVQSGETAVKRLGGKPLGHYDYSVPGAGVTHRLVAAVKVSPTPQGLPRSWGKIKKSPL